MKRVEDGVHRPVVVAILFLAFHAAVFERDGRIDPPVVVGVGGVVARRLGASAEEVVGDEDRAEMSILPLSLWSAGWGFYYSVGAGRSD